MNTECLRIADQLRRAFEGGAWHGPAVQEILSGIGEDQARAHPLKGVHSIWEIVLHIEVWEQIALDVFHGVAMPTNLASKRDWPPASAGNAAWQAAVSQLFATNGQLCQAIEAFQDSRLGDTVPGRKYDFYRLFHGIVQHGLYHAGQIVLLKKAGTES
jgi:uncharacterized damage-inducible protein DinB